MDRYSVEEVADKIRTSYESSAVTLPTPLTPPPFSTLPNKKKNNEKGRREIEL